MNPIESRPTKNQKRQEAREKARAMRERQSKKSKRNKILIQSSLAVALISAIAVVTGLIISTPQTSGFGPLNMQSDGIKIGQGFKAVRTPALAPDALPTPSEPNPDNVRAINIFIDYSCPACASFESQYGPLFRTLLENGAATVEYHPLSFRDAATAGTKYATEAANSAACVAEYAPDSFFEYNEILLANQPAAPEEFRPAINRLPELVEQAGAPNVPEITRCIKGKTFKNWVAQAYKRAMTTGPVPVLNSEVPLITGTPAVMVDGKLYRQEMHGDFATFLLSFENGG
jgi:protein-disulfide isomerase